MKRFLIALNLIALSSLVHSRQPIFIGTDSSAKLADVAIVQVDNAPESKSQTTPKLFVFDILESTDQKLKETMLSFATRKTEFSLAPFFVLNPGMYKIRGYCIFSLRQIYVDLTFDAKQSDRILFRCTGNTPRSAKLELVRSQ